MKVAAILLIAGNSSRFKSSTPKQLFLLNGKPIFSYSLNTFIRNKNIDDIVVVTNDKILKILQKSKYKKTTFVLGGKTRQESVKNGIKALKYSDNDIVIVHDGARPLINDNIINNVIKTTKKYGAVTTYVSVEDTISTISKNNSIGEFIDRNKIVKIQTPQAFHYGLIKKAHSLAKSNNATDDCTLVKKIKHNVKLVEGSKMLTKVTTIEDIKYLESLLK